VLCPATISHEIGSRRAQGDRRPSANTSAPSPHEAGAVPELLRLQETRRLMLDQNMTAGSASALVGYQSASHFNPEYRRLFGAPPQREIRKMRSK
jgi:hypothetical protein